MEIGKHGRRIKLPPCSVHGIFTYLTSCHLVSGPSTLLQQVSLGWLRTSTVFIVKDFIYILLDISAAYETIGKAIFLETSFVP
jgi:hypothetical protein